MKPGRQSLADKVVLLIAGVVTGFGGICMLQAAKAATESSIISLAGVIASYTLAVLILILCGSMIFYALAK